MLDSIDRSNAILVNDMELVLWTIPKTYLRDLESRGAGIVPSIWCDTFDPDALSGFFDTHLSDKIIVKPVISTNAHNTYLLERSVVANLLEEFFENICAATIRRAAVHRKRAGRRRVLIVFLLERV